MPAKSERPGWDDLPSSQRSRYQELDLDQAWYESDDSASGHGGISLPVVGERSDTGEQGFYRLTGLSADDESRLGEQAARIGDYLTFGRDPSSQLDGVIVEGVDAETGETVAVILTTDIDLIEQLSFTGEIRYEQFYQKVSR